MSVPITLTVDLDAAGAVHQYTAVKFVKGGQGTPAVKRDDSRPTTALVSRAPL